MGAGNLGEVSLVLVGAGEILIEVRSKPDLAVGDTLEVAQRNDPVPGELTQMERKDPPGARDMRLCGGLRPGRGQQGRRRRVLPTTSSRPFRATVAQSDRHKLLLDSPFAQTHRALRRSGCQTGRYPPPLPRRAATRADCDRSRKSICRTHTRKSLQNAAMFSF
jgi:hypothetical protein